MSGHIVAESGDIESGDSLLVEVEGIEICVFNLGGDYRACLNWCPHQGGPLCEGELARSLSASFDRETLKTNVELGDGRQVISCPWHGWEFDVETGDCLSRRGVRVPTYDVETRDGSIVVHV